MLETGRIVQVRSRQYLVEDVVAAAHADDSPIVRLSCLEDDALGEQLSVLWNHEVDAKLLGAAGFHRVAERGFDEPTKFSAFLHALRWNCVTSTDARLFQAPYRAGIEVKAYQLEPLRKALLMPRVNLFIADDVGVGKTIEAGLILRELILRQRVRRVVVACPPSVVTQWREEMEQRFGLTFVVMDRAFVAKKRQERGFGINPWSTHSRFILSHALLRDEAYAGQLRDWLSGADARGGSMLILDEAHNFAPASGGRYAIDSKQTKVARTLLPLFEHKLFLSATPHNGHSNSFSALLEMLDPQRFCRGVPVGNKSQGLEAVMVRRLKKDLREISGDFPERRVETIQIDGLPNDAPEIALSRLLDQYRKAREERLSTATRSQRAAAMLVVISLQKRLLSSIEAFARTLKVHSAALARQTAAPAPESSAQTGLLFEAPGADDDRAELPEDQVEKEEDAQVLAASQAGGGPGELEKQLLAEMTRIAEAARHDPDARFEKFLKWIREHQCPGLGKPGAAWTQTRVLVFTEYTDTKRWLVQQLHRALDGCEERVATFHGGMSEAAREAVKAAFNANPDEHPLRILVATDAAREGVNLQNHCSDLFHFDVPWNPGRLEQRNGRIDRKLQRAPFVTCRTFVLPQRAEDRVLQVLIEKTRVIHEQLGALPVVLERKLAAMLTGGIHHGKAQELAQAMLALGTNGAPGEASQEVIEEELEEVRERREKLLAQEEKLQELLANSKKHLQFEPVAFRDALSAALELSGGRGLVVDNPAEAVADDSKARFTLPVQDGPLAHDPSWAATLDTLRVPRKKGEDEREWRRTSPLRPVVFQDPKSLDGKVVHLHLEHRVVQRLLGRFLSQGFRHHDLSRACVLLTDDPKPYVVVLGRLSVYGDQAARLHDEILAVAAEWHAPESKQGRGRRLKPLADNEKEDVLRLVETSLSTPRLREAGKSVRDRFQAGAQSDVDELHERLVKRAETVIGQAKKKLAERGAKEAKELRELLSGLKARIEQQQKRVEDDQLAFAFSDADERKQLDADRKSWTRRLAELEKELTTEPDRVRRGYEVRAQRIEPVGVVYLWPASG